MIEIIILDDWNKGNIHGNSITITNYLVTYFK